MDDRTLLGDLVGGLFLFGMPIALICAAVAALRKDEGESRFAAICRGLWAIIAAIIISVGWLVLWLWICPP